MASIKSGFLILCLLVFSGCEKKPNSIHTNHRFLNLSFHSEIQSLDPRKGIDFPTFFVMKMLFEGLTHVGTDGKIEPGIAKSWEISEDGKIYTFYLRPSVWSNNDKVTAYDFEYSWKRVLNPEDPSLGVPSFYPIKNAEAVSKGDKPIESVGIKVIDPYTIQVELEHPTPYFLDLVATPPFLPINRKVVQEDENWMLKPADEFVCNGPFKLEELHHTDTIVVLKNPSYWEADKVKLPGIRIAIIKDMTTQLNLFEKGELDWLGNPTSKFPMEAIEHMQHINQLKFFNILGVYWYFVNVEAFPFQNRKMRQAFALALNREIMCDTILEKMGSPAMSVLPYSLATQQRAFFDSSDPALAKILFEEALEEMGLTSEELPTITLNYVSSDPEYARVAEESQQQWNKTFGIHVQLEKQDWRGNYSKLQSGNFQIGGMGWMSWIRDPIYILQTFKKKDLGINMSRWESSEYQQLLLKAQQESDPVKRRRFYNQAEGILMNEMPIIPIYFKKSKYSKNEKLKNIYLSELYEADFRWAYLEE